MPFDFEPQATALSMKNAQLLGQAAAMAYDTESRIRSWANVVGLGDVQHFESGPVVPNTDTGGFVAQNDAIVLVAFRGTQPKVPLDWMTDFQAKHVSWGPFQGMVHKGFHDALHAVWEITYPIGEILPARLLSRGDRTVWITGHSLGGAIAELCAAQASFESHVPVQGVYTFGQPRCGDDAFARLVHAALGQRIFRFINDRDIVPRVPFFGMGFRHYGCEIFFNHQETQVPFGAVVENLAAALKLGFDAVNFDAVTEAAQLISAAVMKSALHGNPVQMVEEMMQAKEQAEFGDDLKKVLAAGTENIDDHSMTGHYLPLLKTSLPDLAAAVAATANGGTQVH